MKTIITILLMLFSVLVIGQKHLTFNNKANDTVIYVSTYNEYHFNNVKYHQGKEVTFTIKGYTLYTTMKSQFNKIKLYDIDNTGEDETSTWIQYKCFDDSQSECYLSFVYDKESKTKVIILDYGDLLLYFELKTLPLPKKEYDPMDGIETLGTIHDKDNSVYTKEELKWFLSNFGSNDNVIEMIKNLK